MDDVSDEPPAGLRSPFVAVVTGATGGVGGAVARRLARAGGSLVVLGRRREALATLTEGLRPEAPSVSSVTADLGDDRGLTDAAEAIRGFADQIDVLVHSAGIFRRGSFEQTELDEFDRVHRTNSRARFALTRELLPQVRAASGQVVFISSSLSLRSSAEVGAYAASMHASRALADALRDEVNDDGVRVLSVYLGRTATEMQRRIHEMEGRSYEPDRLIQPETVARTVFQAIDLPRDAEITDLRLRPMQTPPPPDEGA